MKQRTELVSCRDKVERKTQAEQLHKKGVKKYEDSLRKLWDNRKHNDIQITGIPEGEEKEQGIETLLQKILTENFPNLERGKTTHVQEAQREPIEINPKRPTPLHIIIKLY